MFSFLDIVLAIPLLFGMIKGYRQGLIKSVSTLVAIVVSIYLARYFTEPVANWLVATVAIPSKWVGKAAYIVIFLVVSVVMYILACMLTKILSTIKLGLINRIAGALFGFVKYLLIVSLILNILALGDSLLNYKQMDSVKNSFLFEPIEKTLPSVLPSLHFDTMF